MPKSVVLTCLSPEAKDMLESNLKSLDRGTRTVFQQIIEAVADCDENQFIGVEIHETEPVTSRSERLLAECRADAEKRGRRQKRKPSAFNNWIAKCAKGGQKSLTVCAREWKGMSDAEKERFRTPSNGGSSHTGESSY